MRLILKIAFYSALIGIGSSAIIDFALWLLAGLTVPSWTLSGVCAGFLMLLTVTYRMLSKETGN